MQQKGSNSQKKITEKVIQLREATVEAKKLGNAINDVNKGLVRGSKLYERLTEQQQKSLVKEIEQLKKEAKERYTQERSNVRKKVTKETVKKELDKDVTLKDFIMEGLEAIAGKNPVTSAAEIPQEAVNYVQKTINAYKDANQDFVSKLDGSIHATEKALVEHEQKLIKIFEKHAESLKGTDKKIADREIELLKERSKINKNTRADHRDNEKFNPARKDLEYIQEFFQEMTGFGKSRTQQTIEYRKETRGIDARDKIWTSIAENRANEDYKAIEKGQPIAKPTPKVAPKPPAKLKTGVDDISQRESENLPPQEVDMTNLGEKTQGVGSNALGPTIRKADNAQPAYKGGSGGGGVRARQSDEEEPKQPIAPHASFVPATAMTLGESLNTIEPIPIPAIAQNKEFIESFTGAKDARKEYADVVEKTNDTIQKSDEETKKSSKEKFTELHGKMQENIGYMQEGMGSLSTIANTLWQDQIAEAQEKLAEVNEQFNEVVEQRKESDARLQELEEQAKNARGGRAMALQSQIDAEMAKNKQLADQEKNLAKEKEKQEKEIAKKEKQMKKAELAQNIVMGISNTAMAVVKAWGTGGPILGPILAVLAGAAGAVQVAVMTKQLAKMEDGGLLRGKRHTQGGMRIEGSNIEVEGGEYVINRESTRKNMALLGYINTQRKELNPQDVNGFFRMSPKGFPAPFGSHFDMGGMLPPVTTSTNMENAALVDAIRSMKFEPKVAVTDILRIQDEMTQVGGWTGV